MLDRKNKREVLHKFIKQFKESQCLWNPENIYYYNKSAKEDAILALLQLWNRYEPITVPELKSKIQGIRSMYRRERKKVESSQGLYKPTLWYYKHLNFLSGNTHPDSDDSDSDHIDDTLYVQLPRAQKRLASTSIDQEEGIESSIDASAAAFGRSVGAQLHHLSKTQRCIAEKLISDVIYHAKMEQLSLDSSINVKETLDDTMTSEADPSVDTGTAPGASTCEQEPTSSTEPELTAEELVKREIAETESAVSFIKMEENDTENFFFRDVDEIDISKEEFH